MIYIFTILLSMLLITWRVVYISGLADDWNLELDHYIYKLSVNPAIEENTLKYMKRNKIKKWKYYHRLDLWEIKDIINDPFLIEEIHTQVQERYL